MYILGISCFFHDSAVALILNGEIVAAVEEERFTRIKHDSSFPKNGILFCLEVAGIDFTKIEAIVFYDKPLLKFERILESFISSAPHTFWMFVNQMPRWIKEKLFLRKLIQNEIKYLGKGKCPVIKFSEHHLSHAASAFYPSSFNEALVVCLDGVGEWACSSIWLARENRIEPLLEINFPHSLGLFYSAFTGFLGFKVNSGEYKMMGLAPYGNPRFVDQMMSEIIHCHADGSYLLNMNYFNFFSNNQMWSEKLEVFFNCKPRPLEGCIEQVHKDIAASVQVVLEKCVLNLLEKLSLKYKQDNLVLSGGVALNCVLNGKIDKSNYFKNIFVQPAAGDSGGALGCALAYYHQELGKERNISTNWQQGSLLGPEYSNDFIERELKKYNFHYVKIENKKEFHKKISNLLVAGNVVGYFQGRSEFGPRALGARSILGDPRIPNMQSTMNLKIKKRESFRPFAPAILKEKIDVYYNVNLNTLNPYMLFTAQSKNKEDFPATTHIDGSARIQALDKEIHTEFYELVSTFFEQTACPCVINTSFNVRGEPIVLTPKDALNCFMTTGIDTLGIGSFILEKSNQTNESLFKSAYAID